jgi:hypothetical protein
MAKSAKKTTNANKQPVTLSSGQEKATNALIASLEALNPKYLDVATLEDTVQAELVIFYSKFKVEPRSKEARKLNTTAKALLVKYCPNMPMPTIRLMLRCAQASTSVDKLNIKAGTLSAKTVLATFNKAKDNTNKQGRKLSLTGYLRRELPKPKGNKVTKVTPDGGVTFTVSDTAKKIVVHLHDAMLDALHMNECKVSDDELETLQLKIGQAFDEHIVDIKAQA